MDVSVEVDGRARVWAEVVTIAGVVSKVFWFLGELNAYKPAIRMGATAYLMMLVAAWRFEASYMRTADQNEFESKQWPQTRRWLLSPLWWALSGVVFFILFPPA